MDLTLNIIDIGAYGGIHPDWRRIGNALHAYGFEPHAEECGRLNQNAASSKIPLRFFPYAISGHGGKQKFYLTESPTCASLREPDFDEFKKYGVPGTTRVSRGNVKDIIDLETITLDDFCKRERIKADFIKLDTQGTEYEILNEGFQDGLNDLIALETEVEFVPLYKDQKLFSELELFLRNKGFILIGLKRNLIKRHNGTDCVRGPGGQLIHGDALFFSKAALEGKLSEVSAKKAILLAYRFSLHDLMHAIASSHGLRASDVQNMIEKARLPFEWSVVLKKLFSLRTIKSLVRPHKDRGAIVQFDDHYGMSRAWPFLSHRLEKLR